MRYEQRYEEQLMGDILLRQRREQATRLKSDILGKYTVCCDCVKPLCEWNMRRDMIADIAFYVSKCLFTIVNVYDVITC